ncbi:hypothetical protein OOK13_39185 [Streptomyces sp. NBC_00378]|uniref:hypothetical protein n=1 Tax=unclassified Streptomyces TaxID=2593676 RepID=UPI002253C7FE|nr:MULTISPECIES: hypothetical protein [unclassified Streptomyces]MCX5114384.1 hypothetical protein [Streptomyces sp. NBC_00378]
MSTALVRRPTEDAALRSMTPRRMPPVGQVADRLIAARATGDRHGQQLFSCLLDRALGIVPQGS